MIIPFSKSSCEYIFSVEEDIKGKVDVVGKEDEEEIGGEEDIDDEERDDWETVVFCFLF